MKIIDDFPLPIKIVSEDEKKRMEQSLRRSNRILKSHHESAKRNGFSGDRRSFFASVCRGLQPQVPKEDAQEILKAKEIEADFLAVYSRMLFKISSKWTQRLDKSMSRDDISSVAMEGFLRAFSCFTEENIRFSSYLTHCVDGHVIDFVSSFQNQFSIPSEVFKLRCKARKIMAEEGETLDSALDKLNLPRKTRTTLIRSMCDTVRLGPENDIPAKQTVPELPMKLISEFPDEFSGLDKVVFDEFLRSGSEINLSEISKRTINLSTGKPYSRMSICFAWKRVRSKIREQYGEVA